MKYPPIQIVDKNDNPIGEASMLDAYKQSLIHRVAYVVVEDKQGQILLQKRSQDVYNFPNRWDISAAGHVDAGESYEEAAIRETTEELGIKILNIKELGSFYKEDELSGNLLKRFNKVYKTIIDHDTELHPAPFEISELKWFEPDSIKQLIKNEPDNVAWGLVDSISNFY